MATQGLWNLGSVNIPDLGWSEKINAATGWLSNWNNPLVKQVQATDNNTQSYDVPLNPSGQSTIGMPSYFSGAGNTGTTTSKINTGNNTGTVPQQTTSQQYTPTSDVSDSDVNWIFQDLDNQLGQLGNWKSQQEAAVNNAGQGQYTAAQENYDTNKSSLEANRATEDMRAKQSLRDLAQNTTDLFDKLALQFGGGSALRDVLSAATRSVNQSRGNLMNTRNQGYQAIDAKVADLDKVYSTQKDKIKQWVDGKIIDVGNAISQLQYDIAGQKTNVRNQMKQQAIDSARNYLNTIAAQKATFEQQLDYWKRMREADLSEELKSATAGAQYDPHTYSDKSGIQLPTGNVFAPNKDNSADIATAQYNTTGTTKKKNEDELGFTPTSSLPSYFK